MTTDDYKKIAPSLPADPGVYRYVNEEGIVLYVGKAKNLKKRLASYFGERKDRAHKTRLLVKNAHHIEYTIVETETDALLLENTLIKKFQPRYNVMLKDGKGYSYICIKKEAFPRVFITRRVIKDGSTYFGPYISRWRTGIILDLIKQLFPLRTCNFNLSQKNIQAGKFKVCLEYHIKNCEGGCVGYESPENYEEKIEQIKNILKGNYAAVVRHFKEEMHTLAENLEFEKAQQLKEKLDAFSDYQGKSTVVSTNIRDIDVFSIASTEKEAFVNYMKIVNGAVIHVHTQEMVKNLNDNEAELLAFVIPTIREQFNSIADEIIVPLPVTIPSETLKTTIPQRGDKKHLLDLSLKNVRYYLLQKQKKEATYTQKQTSTERILRTMQEDLQMDELPIHLECFDNSNIQGSNPVASCVVFKNGKPSKKDYRHFHIKTVVGANDFASMEEIIYRRYKRLVLEGKSLPQLVIIDGGKGQLSSAMNSIRALGLEGKMTVVGIAKRLEEIFFPDDSIPLYINKKSESLKVIQHARNEAHRFAITFHRNQRSKTFLDTILTEIPGVGEKSAQKLLTAFGSVKKIKEATTAQIAEEVGMAMAKKVAAFLKDK